MSQRGEIRMGWQQSEGGSSQESSLHGADLSWTYFQTRVPAKWVLTGEHSVLKGATAVALPHPELSLSLEFTPDPSLKRLVVHPSSAQDMLQEWMAELIQGEVPSGVLRIQSQIPIGAGMGSSAALCVAFTQWVAPHLKMTPEQHVEFATRLEHQFHGKSSGMDVAVIALGQPILFQMKRGSSGIQKLEVSHLPRFTFHDTGVRSRTRDCIEKVDCYRQENPHEAQLVDERMGRASELAKEGLIQYHHGERTQALSLLIQAMEEARLCFYDWGLVPQEAQDLERSLYEQGACAVKLTGAGGGGMMVALWKD